MIPKIRHALVLLCAVLAAVVAPSVRAQEGAQNGGGMALVIGAGAYRGVAPIANARADAGYIANGLRNAGLTVQAVPDTDAKALRNLVSALAKSVPATGGAFFYFRGHVVQAPARDRSEGMDNWLLGVDETGPTDASLSLGDILTLLNAGGVTRQVIVLDGAPPTAGLPAGFAQPGARSLRRSVIVLNTSGSSPPGIPGSFASALSAELGDSAAPTGELMLRVAGRVSARMAAAQRPLVIGSGESSRWVLNPNAASRRATPVIDPDVTVAMTLRYREAIACGTQACLAAGANAVGGTLRTDLERRLAAITPVDDFDPGADARTLPQTPLNPAQRGMIDALAIDARGKYQVGLWFLWGAATLPRDDELAFTWFKEAVRPDAAGTAAADAATLWYRAKANFVLGWFYHAGRGPGAKKDPATALRYWRGTGSDAGDPDVMSYLADYTDRCVERVNSCQKTAASELRARASAKGVTRLRSPADPDFPMKAP